VGRSTSFKFLLLSFKSCVTFIQSASQDYAGRFLWNKTWDIRHYGAGCGRSMVQVAIGSIGTVPRLIERIEVGKHSNLPRFIVIKTTNSWRKHFFQSFLQNLFPNRGILAKFLNLEHVSVSSKWASSKAWIDVGPRSLDAVVDMVPEIEMCKSNPPPN
jgi:hypothetical protein